VVNSPRKPKRARDRWALSLVVGSKPLRLVGKSREELIRLSGCSSDQEQKFIASIEAAVGGYVAAKEVIENEMPAVVRRSLRELEQKLDDAIEAASLLPDTAKHLFKGGRFDIRLRDALKPLRTDLEAAYRRTQQWPRARVVDYPRLALIINLAIALRDIAKIRPTPTRNGRFQHCAQVLLRSIDRDVTHVDDLTRTLRNALRSHTYTRDRTQQSRLRKALT